MKDENKKALELIVEFMTDRDIDGNVEWLAATIEAIEQVEDVDTIYKNMLICMRGFANVLEGVSDIKDTPKIEA